MRKLAIFLCACSQSSVSADAGIDAAEEPVIDAGSPPCTGITKGPWVLKMTETEVLVRWEACSQGTPAEIKFGKEGGALDRTAQSTEKATPVNETYVAPLAPDRAVDWARIYYMHDVTLTGLEASTCYAYALAADASRTGRFCTARKPGDSFTFMAIGDTNPGLGATTDVLKHALPRAPDFTAHLGDIQYYSSFLETWAFWFEAMAPMLKQGAFLPALGNHEFESPEETIEYTERFFGGVNPAEYYEFSSGGVHFFALNTEASLADTSGQAAWLGSRLDAASKEPGYKASIVYSHRPIVTCGDTGDDPAAKTYMEPLFLKYKVPLVLSAHMHGYERFDFGALTYVTTAGGGGRMGKVDENMSRAYCGSRVASGAFFHASIIEIKPASFHLTVIDETGVVRDEVEKALP